MSKTLNLLDQLLTNARTYQQLGLTRKALQVLGRIGSFRQLPRQVAEEAHSRLAELHLAEQRYPEARRHLSVALAHRPDDGRLHYQMATALELDEQSDPRRAGEHFRLALQHDPDQPACLSDYGLLALSQGDDEEGIQALRRAVELAPDDAEIVGKLVEGLCQIGQNEEARLTLRAALFRNSKHPGFRKLWNDFRFQELCEAQQAEHRRRRNRLEEAQGPVFLPFVAPPPGDASRPSGRKRIRRDGPSSPAPPHAPYSVHLPDRKHA